MSIQIKIFSPKDQKIKTLIYGAPGTGKTTFIGTANKVLVWNLESGLIAIRDKEIPYVDIKTLKDLEELYMFLAKWDHDYETFALDSLSELNDILQSEIERKNDGEMWWDGRWELKKRMLAILKKFRDLPMNVIFVAQETTKDDNEKITKYIPLLSGSVVRRAPGFFDIVARLTIEDVSDEEDKYKITVSGRHNTVTKSRGSYITDDTPPDFGEWIKAFKSIKTTDKEKVVEDIKEVDPYKEALEESKLQKKFHVNAEKTWASLNKSKAVAAELWDKAVEVKAQIEQSDMFDDATKKKYYAFIDSSIKKIWQQV